MSIQVGQRIHNKFMKAYVRGEAKPRQINLSAKIDFDTVYAVVSSMIIWGGFFLAFWSLT